MAQAAERQVLVGGSKNPAWRKITEYVDGWLPIYSGDPDALVADIAELRARAGDRPLPVTVMNAPADKDVLAELADGGVERALLELKRADRDTTLTALDQHVGLLT